ncbi:NTP transferase domain-containing protein [Sphingomonas crocodyli]|uniref:MobA-like NTP transferase domain-containing protein n=1 Tax=Sphingomonas crocodyli TaxID=1979270 RepID=A0A437MA91_9SPHN|nr:NTP transferase domain-containing protein [Sphingomonas crocodyli]RVT94538.1 hypothetical protein EOD43_12080 [Sphingomonas crocodyli]
MNDTRLTIILLAGQRPGVDPLASHFGIERKALVPVAGRPMLDRVAQTLLKRDDVGRLVIVGQAPEGFFEHPQTRWLRGDPRVETHDGPGSIVEAILGAIAARGLQWPILVTTADNVLLSNAMVDAFVAGAAGADIGVALVERRTLEAAYPGNKRTWLRFRGGAYSGANLFWLGGSGAEKALGVWRGIEQQRKKARAVLGAFGYGLALLIGLRIASLDQAIAIAGRRLGIRAKAVVLPQAEACIDVDKLSDHELVEAIFAARTLLPPN